jgi:O-antigen/teichoic acid export membrane protein
MTALISFSSFRGHMFNAGSLIVAKIIVYVVYFAAIPIYVAVHGRASYGVVAFFGVLISYSIMIENGLTYAVTLRYTRALAQGEDLGAQRVIQAALPLYISLALLCGVVFLLGADRLAEFFWPNSGYAGTMRIAGFAVALLVADAMFVSVIQAHNRLVALNMVRLAADVFRASALYLAAYTDKPLQTVVWIFLASAILKLVLDAWYCLVYLISTKSLRPLLDTGEIIATLKAAPTMVVISVASLVISLYEKSYAASHVAPQDFAGYALVADLTTKAHVLYYAVLGTTYNALIRYHAKGWSTHILLKANSAALLFIATTYYLPLAVFGEGIISFSLGAEFGAQTMPLLRILCCSSLAYLAFSYFEANLKARGQALILMWIYLLGLGMFVALTPWLFGIFGLIGIGFALLAVFISMLAVTAVTALQKQNDSR